MQAKCSKHKPFHSVLPISYKIADKSRISYSAEKNEKTPKIRSTPEQCKGADRIKAFRMCMFVSRILAIWCRKKTSKDEKEMSTCVFFPVAPKQIHRLKKVDMLKNYIKSPKGSWLLSKRRVAFLFVSFCICVYVIMVMKTRRDAETNNTQRVIVRWEDKSKHNPKR